MQGCGQQEEASLGHLRDAYAATLLIFILIGKEITENINLKGFVWDSNTMRNVVVFQVLFVQLLFFSSVMSDSLWPHGLQHARLLCPSPSPGICSNSCPLTRCCYLTNSFSPVPPFSSCLQSFPASGSFPVSQLFPSGGPRRNKKE